MKSMKVVGAVAGRRGRRWRGRGRVVDILVHTIIIFMIN